MILPTFFGRVSGLNGQVRGWQRALLLLLGLLLLVVRLFDEWLILRRQLACWIYMYDNICK